MSAEPSLRWTDWQGRPLNPAGNEIRRQEQLAVQARKAAEAALRIDPFVAPTYPSDLR